jgi:hypothetical protein
LDFKILFHRILDDLIVRLQLQLLIHDYLGLPIPPLLSLFDLLNLGLPHRLGLWRCPDMLGLGIAARGAVLLLLLAP